MIMWTTQPYSVYQQVINQDYFYCDPSKLENCKDTDFQLAYQWMIKQLKVKAARPCNHFDVSYFSNVRLRLLTFCFILPNAA